MKKLMLHTRFCTIKLMKDLNGKNKGENGSYYTLPGGAVKLGETLEEAVIREVKEETGLHINVNGFVLSVKPFRGKRSSCNFL